MKRIARWIWNHGHHYQDGLGWYCWFCNRECSSHDELCPVWIAGDYGYEKRNN